METKFPPHSPPRGYGLVVSSPDQFHHLIDNNNDPEFPESYAKKHDHIWRLPGPKAAQKGLNEGTFHRLEESP